MSNFNQYRTGTSPASILIHSDEMIFPWELLIPNETKDGKLTVLKPLGVADVLGRWKPGLTTKPKEQMLKVRKFRVLNPKYSPPNTLTWAAQEAQELLQLFPHLVSLVKPADLPGVMKLFDESDVQVLHFSGHGDVNLSNSDLNEILFSSPTAQAQLQIALESGILVSATSSLSGEVFEIASSQFSPPPGDYVILFRDPGTCNIIARSHEIVEPKWP
ncbi:MAG: hypothetical protein DMG96_08925 [Acidobacteria bacterium]|nr:MAG: hypothetical protein DMG98_19755 [Acidobacteriota bacterium]PYV78200.1 MAG: hypothetical protein DMG96_08925 [Acidobacteriota bacterium]